MEAVGISPSGGCNDGPECTNHQTTARSINGYAETEISDVIAAGLQTFSFLRPLRDARPPGSFLMKGKT